MIENLPQSFIADLSEEITIETVTYLRDTHALDFLTPGGEFTDILRVWRNGDTAMSFLKRIIDFGQINITFDSNGNPLNRREEVDKKSSAKHFGTIITFYGLSIDSQNYFANHTYHRDEDGHILIPNDLPPEVSHNTYKKLEGYYGTRRFNRNAYVLGILAKEMVAFTEGASTSNWIKSIGSKKKMKPIDMKLNNH